jgi:hypothetical protein
MPWPDQENDSCFELDRMFTEPQYFYNDRVAPRQASVKAMLPPNVQKSWHDYVARKAKKTAMERESANVQLS